MAPKNTIQAQEFQIVQAELNKMDGMIGNESKSSRRMIMRFRNEREKKTNNNKMNANDVMILPSELIGNSSAMIKMEWKTSPPMLDTTRITNDGNRAIMRSNKSL